MRVLLVADPKSIHARKVRDGLERALGSEAVHLVSSRSGGAGGGERASRPSVAARARRRIGSALGPDGLAAFYTLKAAGLRRRLARADFPWRPDVILALRLQPEGIGASGLRERFPEVPVALAVWGQDLVLLARRNRWIERWTREAVQGADGLWADTERDIALARSDFGLREHAVTTVMPVNLGLDATELGAAASPRPDDTGPPTLFLGRGADSPKHFFSLTVRALARAYALRPRGFRATVSLPPGRDDAARYTRTELARMADDGFLDVLVGPDRGGFLRALASADLNVSITRSDGLPNTLLEGAWYGTIPLAVQQDGYSPPFLDGVNAYLVPDAAEDTVVAGVERALDSSARWPEMRDRLRELASGYTSARCEAQCLDFLREVAAG